MELDAMIDTAVSTFKQKMHEACKDFDDQSLDPPLAGQVTQALQGALSAAGVSGLRTFLEGYETDASSVMINGTVYRFKQASAKTFLTPFGAMELSRNLYQREVAGPCYIPLDEHWGMVGEFATLEVREAVLFSCAHITPEETVDVLDKCALFQVSAKPASGVQACPGPGTGDNPSCN